MFTTIDIINENIILVLNFLNHMNCGKTLQVIIDQYAHQYGPVALFRTHIAHTLHHSTKHKSSVIWATPTIEPVIIITIFISSICCSSKPLN
jgi:hypothetical protein